MLTAPSNGSILGNCESTYGSVCEFVCDEGYKLDGSATRNCTIDGNNYMVWSGTVVTCPGRKRGHTCKLIKNKNRKLVSEAIPYVLK